MEFTLSGKCGVISLEMLTSLGSVNKAETSIQGSVRGRKFNRKKK